MKNLIALLIIALLGLSNMTFANYGDDKEKKAREAFQMLLQKGDKNSDLKLSKDEFIAAKEDKTLAEEKFPKLDANSDGFITEDEYVKAKIDMARDHDTKKKSK